MLSIYILPKLERSDPNCEVHFEIERHTCSFTAHGWAFTEGVKPAKKFLYLVIEKLMSRITDSIICVSDFDKQLALKSRFNRLKLTTIHNGIADVPAVKQTLKANHITILARSSWNVA